MKKIFIEQFIDDNGMSVITGNCEICNQFPCKHIKTDFGFWGIKSLPKISKDKKRAKIRENIFRERITNK